jgi:integrase/recombinase XerD
MNADEWDAHRAEYRREMELEGYRSRTVQGRLWLAEKFVLWCREREILSPKALTPALLYVYRRHRLERLNARGRRDGPLTVNLHLEGLRDFLGRLSRKGLLSVSFLESLRPIRTPKRLPLGTLAHPEMLRILERIPGDTPLHLRDRALLEMLYSTGLRREELVQVAVVDVDFAGEMVRVEEGKGGKGRVVPLGKVAALWVEKYLRSARPSLLGRQEDPGKLFLSKSGRPLNGNAIREIVRRWTKAAGIQKPASPHTFRRSCATGMIRNRANPAHVKDLLGHDDFRSLDAYVRLEIQDLKEAHRKFHPREQDGDEEDPADNAPVGPAPS